MRPPAPRPCIEPGCSTLAAPGQPRCPEHGRLVVSAHNARRSALAPRNGAAAQLRRWLNRQGSGYCRACGLAFVAAALEVDHVLALADGGTDTPDNVQALCHPCHRAKTTDEQRRRSPNATDRRFGVTPP